MHSTKVTLIANQEIRFGNRDINIHDIQTLIIEDDIIVEIILTTGVLIKSTIPYICKHHGKFEGFEPRCENCVER